MAMWSYIGVVLAISCCAFVGTCFGAPAAAGPEDSSAAVYRSSGSSARNAFDNVFTLIRNKRQTGQCQQIGEYCRYHEECCSQLCLSFSYKCVNRPGQSEFTPTIQQGQNAGAQTSFVGDVGNRFGDSSNIPSLSPSSSTGQCIANGGYCQRSTDCCSRTCLSFSYKCVGSATTSVVNRPPSGNVFEVGQFGPRPEDELTIEELVNRFGGDSSVSTNSVLPLATSTRAPLPTTNTVSGSTNGIPTTTTRIPNNTPRCTGSGGQCETNNQCCTGLCVRIGASNQFCAETVQEQQKPQQSPTMGPTSFPTTSTTATTVNCLEIGFKCYAHAECCTGRCHMFLHQCVT